MTKYFEIKVVLTLMVCKKLFNLEKTLKKTLKKTYPAHIRPHSHSVAHMYMLLTPTPSQPLSHTHRHALTPSFLLFFIHTCAHIFTHALTVRNSRRQKQ